MASVASAHFGPQGILDDGPPVLTVTIPAGGPGTLTYLTGLHVAGTGSTNPGVVNVTVTGLQGGDLIIPLPVLGVAAGPINDQAGLDIHFPSPLPAAAENSAITVTLDSLPLGATCATLNAYGHVRL